MRLFCNHKWNIISDVTTESKFQHAVKSARENGVAGKTNIPHQMCDAERKHIQILSCEKCGKLNRFVERL